MLLCIDASLPLRYTYVQYLGCSSCHPNDNLSLPTAHQTPVSASSRSSKHTFEMQSTRILADLLRSNGILQHSQPPEKSLLKRFVRQNHCAITTSLIVLLIVSNFVYFVNHRHEFMHCAHAALTCIGTTVVALTYVVFRVRRADVEDLLDDVDQFVVERKKMHK